MCGSGIHRPQRQMLHPKSPFLPALCWLRHGLSHTVHSSGGGVLPPRGRVDTLSLTALCQRETIHPLSPSQPVSWHPGACVGLGHLEDSSFPRLPTLYPANCRTRGLEQNADIITEQCMPFPYVLQYGYHKNGPSVLLQRG